ncbi:hypothetical protein K1T71_001962 [Dendrolimus kikuchii]|uniref:Uncharacterized protein n=1 Tax=Dendrolimus kikuchii TaxID=765133 RepID=A0ACC1DFY7_9NEOP|nr:hypothetical protein K1T71_001962 [Dendrolimus kikuchii]
MEAQRRHRNIQDQENVIVMKEKDVGRVPIKKQGLAVRGALGDLNTNLQAQREIVGKVAVTAAEFEKKVTLKRGDCKSKFVHVQSKVDTGLIIKNAQPASRPPLRREESTANLANRAAAYTRAVFKDSQNIQMKKITQEKKTKLPVLKEITKEKSHKAVKEQTECLGKLKLEISNKISAKTQTPPIETQTPPIEELSVKLPSDIEDIDAGDGNSPLLLSIYIKDIYKYLTELEEKYAIEQDYLRNQTAVTGKMRATLLDWLVDVHQQFNLILETFQLTVGIIDRYLQVASVQRNRLQLVGITALFIASKYEEIYIPDSCDFVAVTDNTYTISELLQCEKEILSKLGFCLARPIPLSFLRRFVKAANGTSKNHHLAKYFVDLCLVEYTMAHYKPSELAAAAICLSLYVLSSKDLETLWTPTLAYYSGYPLSYVQPIMWKIAKIVVNVQNSNHQAVFKKYSDTTLAKVSLLPQLRGAAIRQLAEMASP